MQMDTAAHGLQQLVLRMVDQLVDKPREVDVFYTTSNGFVDLEVHVAEEDRGRVIGRNGTTARAIRTIVEAAAVKAGVRCMVNLVREAR